MIRLSYPRFAAAAHAFAQQRTVKRLLRLARVVTIRLLGLARGIEFVRNRLHLPANGVVDPLQCGPSPLLTTLRVGMPEPFRRALPLLPEDVGVEGYFSNRAQEIPEEEYVAILPRGSVWGCAHGAVFTAKDHFVPTFARDPWGAALHQVWTRAHLPMARRLNGRALYLVTPEAADNFHHWMIDLLPRISTVERAGMPLSSFDHIIVDHSNRAYQWETLGRLGVPKNRVVHIGPSQRLQPDELVIPSLKSTNERLPSEHVAFLSERLLPTRPTTRNRRLFLSRRDAPARRLSNEADVFEILKQHGFESVCLSRLSVAEQAQLFAEAEIVAGPSGAAFANLVFCSPGTLVLELSSPTWLTVYHWMISARRGLRHAVVLGPGGPPPEILNIAGRGADLWIDPQKIARVMARLPRLGDAISAGSEATPGTSRSPYPPGAILRAGAAPASG